MIGVQKKRQMTLEEGEENYLASVSDMMVGLLFVFIIMLMAVAMNYEKAKKTHTKTISEYQQARKTRDTVLKEMESALKVQGVKVQIDLDNGILRLPEELLFDVGKAEFRSGGERAIKVLSSELLENLPRCKQLETVLVEGHSDNTPIAGAYSDSLATYRDNWDLSFQRAKRTYQTLFAKTPGLQKLQNSHHSPLISMSAYGETRPVADNRNANGKRKNRRIDIRLVIESPEIKH